MLEGVGIIVTSSFERAPWGWGLFVAVLLVVLKNWSTCKQMAIGEHAQIRVEYVNEIKALREEVKELRDKNEDLMRELGEVKLELAGYKRQHIAEQAASIRHAPAVKEAVVEVAREVVKQEVKQ